MAFVDNKERVMEIILTQHGRKLLNKGKLIAKYYKFFDDEVDYQTAISDAASGILTPLEIFSNNVALWLDRSYGITYGTPPAIAAWADQTGNINDATQGTSGFRPTLTGQGIDFDGTDDRLVVLDSSSLDLTTKMTVGMRLSLDSSATDQCILSKCPTTGGSWCIQNVGSDARIWFRFNPLSIYGKTPAIASATLYSIIWMFDGTASGNSGRLRVWINGVEQSMVYNGTIPASLTTTADDLTIGKFVDLAGQYFNGQIRSIVIIPNSVTSEQISLLNSYLDES